MALGALCAVASASCSHPPPHALPSSVPKIERLLDHPDRLTFSPPEAHAEDGRTQQPDPGPRRWDRAAIGREWHLEGDGQGGTLRRSPRLSFDSLAQIEALELTLATDRPPASATLLWNDRETLSREEQLRNRRELTLPVKHGTLVTRGEDIFDSSWHEHEGAGHAFRYLFVRLPPESTAPTIESVRIVAKSDVYSSKPSGQARQAIHGELRNLLYVRTPGAISYRTQIPAGAELALGVASFEPDATVRYTVSVGSGEAPESVVLVDRHEPGSGWRDVRVPLPATPAEGGRLVLRADSDRPGTTAIWSAPMIVTPRRDGDPPNVVLYVVDTLRADHLGLFGYPRQTSPFLDQLGGRGVVFRRCFAGATWTKPAVATLMTSLYPQTHGVGGRTYTDAMPEGAQTLADRMHDAGYVTAQFVANPMAGSLSNLDQGFDYALGPDGLPWRSESGPAKVRSDEINARVLPWLTAHARDRFFIYIQSMDPHPPLEPGAKPSDAGATSEPYDAEIRANDLAIRHLYDRLVELGLARTTLFVVTADHGEAFGEHGQAGHGASVYQEEAHVPLIMVRQGALAPAVIDVPVHHVDVLPTILGHCSIALGGSRSEGIDLLAHPSRAWPARTLFVSRFTYPFDERREGSRDRELYAVVQQQWKLIVRVPNDPRKPPEKVLYDLDRDPGERRDLSKTDQGRVGELSRALEAFLDRQREQRAAFLERYPGPATMGLAGGSDGRAPVISAEVIERLKGLGYIR